MSQEQIRPPWLTELLASTDDSIRERFEARPRQKQELYIAELTDYREMLVESLGLDPDEIRAALLREIDGYITEDRYH